MRAKIIDRWQELEQKMLQGGSTQSAPIVALPKPTREFKDYYGIAKLIGLDKNAAAIAANQAVIKLTGTDVLQLLEPLSDWDEAAQSAPDDCVDQRIHW